MQSLFKFCSLDLRHWEKAIQNRDNLFIDKSNPNSYFIYSLKDGDEEFEMVAEDKGLRHSMLVSRRAGQIKIVCKFKYKK